MKHFTTFFLIASLLLTLVGCDNQELKNLVSEQDYEEVTLSLEVPEAVATKAVVTTGSSSDKGGVTNMGASALNWLVVVTLGNANPVFSGDNKNVAYYYRTGNTSGTPTPMANGTANTNGVNFTGTMRLLREQNYTLYAVATVNQNIMTAIAANSGTPLAPVPTALTPTINNENRDIYWLKASFHSKNNVTAGTSGSPNTISLGTNNANNKLKRPLGKVRLVATDYKELQTLYNLKVKSVQVDYTFPATGQTARNTIFSYLTGQWSGTNTTTSFTKSYATTGTNVGYDADLLYANEPPTSTASTATKNTLYIDYIPVNSDFNLSSLKFTFTLSDNKTVTHTIANVPVKRNGLTTIEGDVFLIGGQFTITVDENFASTEQKTITTTP